MHFRKLSLVIVVLLALGALTQPRSLGQPNGPPPAPPANDPKLDQLLMRWEKESVRCETMAADVTCIRKNPVFDKTEKLIGTAKFMRLPNGEYAARIELKSPENPNNYEKYICTGGFIYQFQPDQKTIAVYSVPPKQGGQLPDDGPLPFLFGMRAETAKQRYALKIMKEVNGRKLTENEIYTYIEVQPLFPRDKRDFTYARLAILNKDYPTFPKDLPKEIFWVEPTKAQVTWDITKIQRNVPGSVDRREFVKPDLPPGWQWQTQPTAANPPATSRPPTVIRQQDK